MPKYYIKSRYTTAQLLRFPMLFGSVLGVFIIAFKYRKVYFGDEIEAVRQRNYEETMRQYEIMEKAKENVAGQVAAKYQGKQK